MTARCEATLQTRLMWARGGGLVVCLLPLAHQGWHGGVLGPVVSYYWPRVIHIADSGADRTTCCGVELPTITARGGSFLRGRRAETRRRVTCRMYLQAQTPIPTPAGHARSKPGHFFGPHPGATFVHERWEYPT